MRPVNRQSQIVNESVLLALLGRRADRRDFFRHFPAHFILDDFGQRDVGQAHARGHDHQRTAQAAAPGVELAHAARDEVHQHVGVAHFFHGTFAKFSVHYYSKIEFLSIPDKNRRAITKNSLVGGSSKGEFCVKSKGDKLQGVIPEDFWPVVEWRGWGLSDGPELSERVMD